SKHETRMQASPEYKNMLEDIKHLNKKEEETEVTIQEAKLKKERDEAEARSTARNNQRRHSINAGDAKHLPLEAEDKDSDKKIKVDFVQDESLNVMADMISLVKKLYNKKDKSG